MKLYQQSNDTIEKRLFIDSNWTEISIDFIQRLDYKYEKVDAMVLSICRVNVHFVNRVVQASTF